MSSWNVASGRTLLAHAESKTGLHLCPFFPAQSVLRPKTPGFLNLVTRVATVQSPLLLKRIWTRCYARTSSVSPTTRHQNGFP